MATDSIVQELNAEIDRLTRARDVLIQGRAGTRTIGIVRRRRPMSAANESKDRRRYRKAMGSKTSEKEIVISAALQFLSHVHHVGSCSAELQ